MKTLLYRFLPTIALGLFFTLLVIALQTEKPKNILLPVPYASQAPGKDWVAPWDESCEEAVAIMVDAYYKKEKNVTNDDVARTILEIVSWEDKNLGKNKDTNALEIQKFIGRTVSFDATILRNPTIEDIKKQLRKRRPVIALINMYQHCNPRGTGTGTKRASWIKSMVRR